MGRRQRPFRGPLRIAVCCIVAGFWELRLCPPDIDSCGHKKVNSPGVATTRFPGPWTARSVQQLPEVCAQLFGSDSERVDDAKSTVGVDDHQ